MSHTDTTTCPNCGQVLLYVVLLYWYYVGAVVSCPACEWVWTWED